MHQLLVLSALCIADTHETPRATSVVRRQEDGARVEVSAGGSFPHGRSRLRQSEKRSAILEAESALGIARSIPAMFEDGRDSTAAVAATTTAHFSQEEDMKGVVVVAKDALPSAESVRQNKAAAKDKAESVRQKAAGKNKVQEAGESTSDEQQASDGKAADEGFDVPGPAPPPPPPPVHKRPEKLWKHNKVDENQEFEERPSGQDQNEKKLHSSGESTVTEDASSAQEDESGKKISSVDHETATEDPSRSWEKANEDDTQSRGAGQGEEDIAAVPHQAISKGPLRTKRHLDPSTEAVPIHSHDRAGNLPREETAGRSETDVHTKPTLDPRLESMSAPEQDYERTQVVQKSMQASPASVRSRSQAKPSAKAKETRGVEVVLPFTTTQQERLPGKVRIEMKPNLAPRIPPQYYDPESKEPYFDGPSNLQVSPANEDSTSSSDTTSEVEMARSAKAADATPGSLNVALESPADEGNSQYGLRYPPKNRPQLEQYLRIAREMERVELMGGISEQGARNAFKNLYANWTHTDYNVRERYLSGIRIRTVGEQIFYTPEPPELRQLATTQPLVFEHMFSIVAAHVLSFLSRTMSMFKLPNADFTIAFGDFCLGTTRLFHDAWGSKKRHDVDLLESPAVPGAAKSEADDAVEPDGPPNAAITEAFQAPVFQWTTSQSGRKACNVITTSTYDWNWWGSNFTQGSRWRLAHVPPTWKQRLQKVVWRGSLMSQDSIRSRAIRVGLRHPELFDIKGTKIEECEKFVADLVGFNDHNTLSECQTSVSSFYALEHQQQYKYTLEMDGGGATFRFKNLLLGGFLVFKVDADTTQFWSDSLQPFVHYVPVSRANFEQDLVRKLRWAMEHDADCEQIAANARNFASQYLRDVDAHWQQQAAISMYAGKQNYVPVGPEPDMMRFCCRDAANVNLMKGVKLSGVGYDCVDRDPACAEEASPKEMLYSVPRLQAMMTGATLAELAQDLNTTQDVILKLHHISSIANPSPPVSNMQIWKEFGDLLQPFKLIEGHVMQDRAQAQAFTEYAALPNVKTICETGFNAGHSTLLFLLANPHVHVYSFDLSHYRYTTPAVEFLSSRFPSRLTFVKGDSTKTLSDFRKEHPNVKCDLAVVDGAHIAPWVNTDLLNFWHMASGPTSTIIMNDAPCDISWCTGPTAAWRSMISSGAIREITSTKSSRSHGFSVGVFQKAPGTEELHTVAVEWPTPATDPIRILQANTGTGIRASTPSPSYATLQQKGAPSNILNILQRPAVSPATSR